ncbi:ribonuclease P protein component [Thioalkalivibrio sp.]|uniref:ribonuclease P protein component n=1 Tax=Thioalkalivibrio sp. TaxID=2093813 RepID=UPI0012D4F980|nr:ribonuclease P protein component [Thioalkalivibrio sp.]TVP79043.1 MAG: ribonuclease P protein component [Thioalkalivibrio sp.]
MTTAPVRITDQGFPRSGRLLAGREYQRVFARARRAPGGRFMVLYRKQEPAGPAARLGLAISKKHARRSVDRNRIKRVAREAFRARRQSLPPVDIIVLSRAGIAGAERAELRAELDRLLENLK